MVTKPFESRIQDLVYNVDVGFGLRFIKGGLYFLFIFIVMLMYTATQFRGLKDPEAMDFAQLGRNLSQQGHFITEYVRPVSLWYLRTHSAKHDAMINRHPDIVHPPVYPVLLATLFKVTGVSFDFNRATGPIPPEQWIMVPLNHLFTLLTGLLVYLLGRRLFDGRLALLATTIFFLSDRVWADSISASGVSLCVFLATAVFYFVLVATTNYQEGLRKLHWVLPLAISVLLCIGAFLTRYALIVLVPAVALHVGLMIRKRTWLWIAGILLVVLIGVSPWLIRNKAVSGGFLGLAPYMALNDSSMFEGNSFECSLSPKIKAGVVANALQTKWMEKMAGFYHLQFRTVGDGILICFFIVTFFYRFARPYVNLFRWSVALGFVLLLCLAAFFGDPTVRLLTIFWPVIILYGLAFFSVLLDRLQFPIRLLNSAVTTLVVLLSAAPLIFTILPPRASVPYPPYFPPFITHVSKMLTADELLCTDMPWATAWYGGRNSILLPASVDEFYEINDYVKRVGGIYFTTLTRDKPYVRGLLTGSYRTWFPILEGRIPGDFPLTQGFPLNNMDQLFLSDRIRWNR